MIDRRTFVTSALGSTVAVSVCPLPASFTVGDGPVYLGRPLSDWLREYERGNCETGLYRQSYELELALAAFGLDAVVAMARVLAKSPERWREMLFRDVTGRVVTHCPRTKQYLLDLAQSEFWVALIGLRRCAGDPEVRQFLLGTARGCGGLGRRAAALASWTSNWTELPETVAALESVLHDYAAAPRSDRLRAISVDICRIAELIPELPLTIERKLVLCELLLRANQPTHPLDEHPHAAAAAALRSIGEPGLPRLLRLALEGGPECRRVAIRQIAWLQINVVSMLPHLLPLAASADDSTRHIAYCILGELGPLPAPGIECLRAGIEDKLATVRLEAALALLKNGQNDPRAIAAIEGSIERADPELFWRVAGAWVEVRGIVPETCRLLVRWAGSPDFEKRSFALHRISWLEVQSPELFAELLQQWNRADVWTQAGYVFLIEALAAQDWRSVVPLAVENLSSQRAERRCGAIRLLAYHAARRAFRPLAGKPEEREVVTVQGPGSPTATEALRRHWRYGPREDRLAVLLACEWAAGCSQSLMLELTDDVDVLQAWENCLERPHTLCREQLETICQLGRQYAARFLPKVLRVIGHVDAICDFGAGEAIGALGADWPQSVRLLFTDGNPRVRRGAAIAVCAIAQRAPGSSLPRAIRGLLQAGLDDPDLAVRAACQEALEIAAARS